MKVKIPQTDKNQNDMYVHVSLLHRNSSILHFATNRPIYKNKWWKEKLQSRGVQGHIPQEMFSILTPKSFSSSGFLSHFENWPNFP